jgi:hypothetical protein
MAARQRESEINHLAYWSTAMHSIDVDALTNASALRIARGVEIDRTKGLSLLEAFQRREVPDNLVRSVQAITQAVAGGWFEIPRGPGMTFSKTQHASLTSLAARAPWLIEIQSEATTFEAYRSKFTPERGYSFGVRPMPNIANEAKNISNRLCRLPIDHITGEITVDLWVQILNDTQARVRQIRALIECLSQEWMWEATHALDTQIARLRQFDCTHILHEYVSTTRNRHLDRFESKLLDDVKHRGLAVEQYEARVSAERQRQDDEARSGWMSNYKLIGQLAAILDGVSSYHQGTLSRRIKRESGGQFRLQRSSLNSEALSIELRYQYEVGQSFKFDTPFKLVNYCLALADEIQVAEPVFEDYLSACDRAYERIKDLTEPTNAITPSARRQRPDDFDEAAA